MGRKHLLTDAMLADIADYARFSKYDKDIYEALGIGQTTWFRWLREGELSKEEAKEQKVKNHKRLQELVGTLTRERAKSRLLNLEIIREAAEGYVQTETVVTEENGSRGHKTTEVTKTKRIRHWQAAAWLLERNNPEQYRGDRKLDANPEGDGDDELIFVDEIGEDEDDGMEGQLDG